MRSKWGGMLLTLALWVGTGEVARCMEDGGCHPSPLALLEQAAALSSAAPQPSRLRMEIASVLAIHGHVVESLRLAASLENPSMRDQLISVVAIAQANAGDIVGAVKNAHSLPKDAANDAISVIARIQAGHGDAEGGRHTLSAELEGMPPAQRTGELTNMALCMEEAGFLKEADGVLHTLPGSLSRAREQRVVGILKLRDGDIEGALAAADESYRLFKQHVEREGFAGNRYFPIDPERYRRYVLEEVAIEQARRGSLEAVQKIVVRLPSEQDQIRVLSRCAVIRAEATDRASARLLLDAALKADLTQLKGFDRLDLASALFALGEIERSRELVRTTMDRAGPPLNLSYIVSRQAAFGDIEGACASSKGIRDPAASDQATRHLCCAICKQGDAKRAFNLCRSISSVNVRTETFSQLSSILAAAHDRNGATEALREAMIADENIAGETVRLVARQAFSIGLGCEALQWVTDRVPRAARGHGLLGVAEGLLPPVHRVHAVPKYPF